MRQGVSTSSSFMPIVAGGFVVIWLLPFVASLAPHRLQYIILTALECRRHTSCCQAHRRDEGGAIAKTIRNLRMREVKVAAAQLGPIQQTEPRQTVVARMLDLMKQAKSQHCDLIVYPELALTTFFPRWHYQDRGEADIWFEREMPNAVTTPLFAQAKEFGMAMSFGYAELTADGHHFNTSILVDKAGAIVGKYRKVHLPGHAEFAAERSFQHLEKRYFEPGDLGFPVWRA